MIYMIIIAVIAVIAGYLLMKKMGGCPCCKDEGKDLTNKDADSK